MLQELIVNGQNVIISMKNKNMVAAKALLLSMYENSKDYIDISRYAVQSDIYRFAANSKNKRVSTRRVIDYDIEFAMPPKVELNEPDMSILENEHIAEDYINNLIKQVKEYENAMSTARTDFIVKNQHNLSAIGRKYADDELKNIIRKMVKLT